MSASQSPAQQDNKRQRTGGPTGESARGRNNGQIEHIMINYLMSENERLTQQRDDWQSAWHTSDERASRVFRDNARLIRSNRRHLTEIRSMHSVQEQLFDLCLGMFEAHRPLLTEEQEQFFNILRNPVNAIDLTDLTTDEELSDEE